MLAEVLPELAAQFDGRPAGPVRHHPEIGRALTVCRLHLELRRFDDLRPGTLAKMYEREFRAADFPVELCALAVGADSGGRLGLEAEGEVVAERVARDVRWLREVCVGVDAAALARAHAGDVPALRRALHEARARDCRVAQAGLKEDEKRAAYSALGSDYAVRVSDI